MKANIFKRYDVLAFLCCVGFFSLWPNFDLSISQIFYDEQLGFYLQDHPLAIFIYQATNYIAKAILISLITASIIIWLSKKNARLQLYKKTVLYLLVCVLLGPILMVDIVLKKNLDRPRPSQTLEFGGSYAFNPPFSPTFICQECESFVSGHAAVGFYFLCFALLRRNKKWQLYSLAIALGTVIGMARIIQGGHFLSDIIFSGWAIWFCTLLAYNTIFKK